MTSHDASSRTSCASLSAASTQRWRRCPLSTAQRFAAFCFSGDRGRREHLEAGRTQTQPSKDGEGACGPEERAAAAVRGGAAQAGEETQMGGRASLGGPFCRVLRLRTSRGPPASLGRPCSQVSRPRSASIASQQVSAMLLERGTAGSMARFTPSSGDRTKTVSLPVSQSSAARRRRLRRRKGVPN